jgi:hypothetical protein
MAKKVAKQVKQIGMNDKRRVYKVICEDNAHTIVHGKILEYGLNPSHRWIPLRLYASADVLYITERQAKWLVDRFTLVHKIQGFALQDVTK